MCQMSLAKLGENFRKLLALRQCLLAIGERACVKGNTAFPWEGMAARQQRFDVGVFFLPDGLPAKVDEHRLLRATGFQAQVTPL